MHKPLSSILLIIIVIGITAVFFSHKPQSVQVHVYTGDSFTVPSTCKHLALLGCTPHPTHYLKHQENFLESLKTMTLNDFLDIDYVRDSFERTCIQCKEQKIDHLLIAYLPIYYVEMRQLLGDQFKRGYTLFIQNIIHDMTSLINDIILRTGFLGNVTLILPPDQQLARIPDILENVDDRIRYLIKQFPKLKNISTSPLQTITIINNKDSAEDELLIKYLKYKYLYEKPIIYNKCTTGKERFHKEKTIG